jgi:hypothetical protein
MADISVEVPAHHVHRVRVSLLHELGPVAESIYIRANTCVGGEDEATNLRGDLNELRDIEDVMEDLGWLLGDDEARCVSGHPVLLADVLYGALADQIEDVRESCASYHAGTEGLEVPREHLEGVGELLNLLAAVHGGGGS